MRIVGTPSTTGAPFAPRQLRYVADDVQAIGRDLARVRGTASMFYSTCIRGRVELRSIRQRRGDEFRFDPSSRQPELADRGPPEDIW